MFPCRPPAYPPGSSTKEGGRKMRILRAIVSAATVLATVGALQAQQTTTSKQAAGAAEVTTSSMSGEVAWVQGNLLVCKMLPHGEYRLFDVQPGRQFFIDGQAKLINELKLGTVLTATVITTTQPITLRTTTVTNGTVAWVAGNFVVLTLPSGENREYKVPATYKFMV